MTLVVIDASVAVKWLIEEVDTNSSLALHGEAFVRIAPDYLILECTNAVAKKTKHGDMSKQQARELVNGLESLPISLIPSNQIRTAALELAIELKQSIYDCLYLALAVYNNCQLVTADKNFYKATQKTPFGKHVVELSQLR